MIQWLNWAIYLGDLVNIGVGYQATIQLSEFYL